MEFFTYKGISAGKYVEGEIESLNQEEASHKLKEQKVIITHLDKAKKNISKSKDKVLKDGMVSIEKMKAESQKKSSKSAEAFVKKFLESM